MELMPHRHLEVMGAWGNMGPALLKKNLSFLGSLLKLLILHESTEISFSCQH